MRKLFSALSSTLQGGVRGGLLFLALVATTSVWAEDFSVDGIYYNYLDGNNVEVTYRGDYDYSYKEYAGEVTIPSIVTYNGTTYRVTSIGEQAFMDCSSLTSVTIPNSVTSIGNYTFSGCRSLTSVTIPNSVTSIGEYAFQHCFSLTSVTIPDSVTSIGRSAFAHCTFLTSMFVEEGNTIYDSRDNCNAIIETETNTLIAGCQNTIIPNSVTSLGFGAFSGCSFLTSVTIPNSVTSIGEDAFYNCSSLTSVTIPNSVTSIGDDAFRYCSSLTSVTITNSVTSIGNYTFYGCSSLTSVTIPNSVTSIGNYTFSGCRSLTSVTIPNSVTSIGEDAFYNCSSLTSITVPNSVTSIGKSAFAHCTSLTSMFVEEGNTIYDSRDNCNAIIETETNTLIAGCQNTTIPNSVTSIGYGAFSWYSSLTSVTIPNSVTSIGENAFYNCSSLTSVTIPNSVTSIGERAFSNCSLASITCEAMTPPTLGSNVFYGVSTYIPVYVPCGSENIYKAAYGWKEFTNIQEPQVEYAIQVSTSNSQMGTALVDYNTFCDGAKISATANDYYHFVQWSDGNTDNPRTLTLTQDTVLTAEFALTISGQCGDNLYWSYDETAKTLSITGSGEMYDYTATTQPWLLFKEQIVEVTTNNTVTSIGTSAFEGCVRLAKISLGTGLEEIATNAFAGCTRLYDIYVYATYPPFADESSFANYNVYVYIPCEYQRNYILDVVWGNFKFIECLESEETTTDGNVTVVPGTNDVTITWPTEDNADTYTIVIKKGNDVFCTLTFNKDGQLLNIAFAPGRDGNHPAQYAEQAGKGYRFTVTSLESGTKYGYNIDVKDASNKTIKSHTGEFTTQSTTAVDNITTNNANIQKIMRNGQLIIIRNGVEYNAVGQEVGN